MPSREVILDVIQQCANELLAEPPTLTMESSLDDEDAGIDSLDLIEIVMEVESRLDLQIETDELSGPRSIDALIDLILTKIPRSKG